MGRYFWFDSQLSNAAKEESAFILYDEEKRKAFLEGAHFTARKLLQCCDVHPMETGNTIKEMDKLRLNDVVEVLEFLLSKAEKKF